VQPGETLWSIAAANNLHTNALAVYNGLSVDSQVVLGSTIRVPTTEEALVAVNSVPAAPASTTTTTASTSTGGQGSSTSAPASSSAAPPPLGGYTVQPGDTLTGIAARSGVTPQQIAWMNGLQPDSFVIAGTALKLPSTPGGQAVAASQQSSGTAQSHTPAASTGPVPSAGRTNSSEISSIASEHGVDGALASAIAYQESGFNNAAVSSANARGVMQVMPGTWQWVQDNLATSQLDPASTQDNVRAGVLYMRQLLQDTGGDERMAIASYYQGLGSVRENGLLPETERYVANVQALRGRTP
jgi:N-acetylmuramoyl-L-alanine amidase